MPHESRALALPQVVAGSGCAKDALADALAGVAPTSVLFVGSRSSTLDERSAALREVAPSSVVVDVVRRHAPIECLDAAWRALPDSTQATAVVGIGGGAVCDATKLVAHAFATRRSPRALLDGSGMPRAERRVLTVLVPTTPTAAAFTADASSLVDGAKRVLRGLDLVADTVIIDADASAVPRDVFATSMLPAISHCVDPLLIGRGNPFASSLGTAALEALLPALARLAHEDDAAGRQAGLEGVWLAAAAVSSAGVGLPHALCQAVGAVSGAAHGEVHAMLLPQLLRGPSAWLGAAPTAGFAHVAVAVDEARTALAMPASLEELGLAQPQLREIAERTVKHPMVGRAGAQAPSADDLVLFLERAWERGPARAG